MIDSIKDEDGRSLLGDEIIYTWVVPDHFPRKPGDDVAQSYLVTRCPNASGGVVVYARYGKHWSCNPWSARPLINHLVTTINKVCEHPDPPDNKVLLADNFFKRLKTIEQAVGQMIHLHTCEQEGVGPGMPSPAQWEQGYAVLCEAHDELKTMMSALGRVISFKPFITDDNGSGLVPCKKEGDQEC